MNPGMETEHPERPRVHAGTQAGRQAGRHAGKHVKRYLLFLAASCSLSAGPPPLGSVSGSDGCLLRFFTFYLVVALFDGSDSSAAHDGKIPAGMGKTVNFITFACFCKGFRIT